MLCHSVTEYKNIYYFVLDPLVTSSGQLRSCNLTLGQRIKQRLWDALDCPTLVAKLQPDSTFSITETFSKPPGRRRVPHIDIDMSGEPTPEQPISGLTSFNSEMFSCIVYFLHITLLNTMYCNLIQFRCVNIH